MFPPIYEVCKANAGVRAALGSPEPRLYAFGDAPPNVVKPYAVWQLVGGSPDNNLGEAPNSDGFTLQIDVYALQGDDARSAALALRSALERTANVVGYNGEGRDPVARHYRYSFTVDWILIR